MSTQYIVKFCKNIETVEPSVDGFVELKSTPSGHNLIEVRTMKDTSDASNCTLFHKFITKNFAEITFDDISMECFLEYKDYNKTSGEIKSVIKFDKSSSSAYALFKKNFTEMMCTQNETIYYPSGRVWYIGQVLHVEETGKLVDRVAHGTGTWYYDGVGSRVKYQGEWENGKFDGAGVFYSYDGKMSITANNISSGIPIGKAKLSIGFNKASEIIEINFTEYFDKLNMNKQDKVNFARADNFVKTVAQHFWSSGEPIERVIFRDQSVEDKHVELWNKINELTERVEKLSIENKEQAFKSQKELTGIMFITSLTVIFVQSLLYMLS